MRSGWVTKRKVLPRKGKLIHTFPRSTHFLSCGLELRSKGLSGGPLRAEVVRYAAETLNS